MAHLGDKLAEFFYGELAASDMDETRRHVGECADCRLQVEQFGKLHLSLKSSPDLDPPRRIVFAPPDRRSWLSVFDWRLAAPAAVAAVLVVAVWISLFPAPPPISIQASAPAPVVIQAPEVDYGRIVNEVRQSERTWLTGELEKRDKEIQRLRGELAYYEYFQRTVLKETMENGSSIQLLAQRTESRD